MFKPLIFFTIGLCLIGAGLFYFQDRTSLTQRENSSVGISGQKLLERLDTKALNQIRIQAKGKAVDLLQLRGGGWKEQFLDYEADVQAIQDLLLKLSQIRLGDLVTNNPKYHQRFHLLTPPDNIEIWKGEQHGLSVSLLRGDETPMLSLLLGKERSNGPGQYIRYAGADEIYLIPEKLAVEAEAGEWLNKNLLALEADQIQGLEFQEEDNSSRSGRSGFSISRDSAASAWQTVPAVPELPAENQKVPEVDKIDGLLQRLGDLSFSKLHKESARAERSGLSQEDNFSDKNRPVTGVVSLFDGRIYTLSLNKNKTPNDDYVLSLRMGISLEISGDSATDNSKLRKQMEEFNQRVGGRFFEIPSWQGKDLIIEN